VSCWNALNSPYHAFIGVPETDLGICRILVDASIDELVELQSIANDDCDSGFGVDLTTTSMCLKNPASQRQHLPLHRDNFQKRALRSGYFPDDSPHAWRA